MSDRPGYGEAWNCGRCGKLVLGAGSWGIDPATVCHCASPQPIKPPLSALYGSGLSALGGLNETERLKSEVQNLRADNERLRVVLAEIADGDAHHDGAAYFMAKARRALQQLT